MFPLRLFALGLFLAAAPALAATAAGRLDQIKLPPKFRIDYYARNVPGARSLTLSPKGVLWVGSQEAGKVYAIPRANQVIQVASGLDWPNGVAFRDGSLYVAEISRILRYDGAEAKVLEAAAAGRTSIVGELGAPKIVNASFPSDRGHGWKFIAFGPDGLLYVPVGAPCNVCDRGDRYANIMRMKPDGTGLGLFARGIRNTVGFDWNPADHSLWFTDNGRDLLGDDVPPDELNHAPRIGMNFGFPYCHAGYIDDPDLAKPGHDCKNPEFTAPEMKLGPHVAALGMRFYTGAQFPPEYRGRIFIAEHGSWNRSVKIGYRVTQVTLRNGHAVDYRPFAEGWLQGEGAAKAEWGRPVDVQVAPDGALLVSDDEGGAVYRISYPASGN